MYQPSWQCCAGGCNEWVWGSGCWGAGNAMLADVWHLTKLLYKVAPTHLEGWEHVHTSLPSSTPPSTSLSRSMAQGLGVQNLVCIVLALFVCRALVRVIAHVPNEEAQ